MSLSVCPWWIVLCFAFFEILKVSFWLGGTSEGEEVFWVQLCFFVGWAGKTCSSFLSFFPFFSLVHSSWEWQNPPHLFKYSFLCLNINKKTVCLIFYLYDKIKGNRKQMYFNYNILRSKQFNCTLCVLMFSCYACVAIKMSINAIGSTLFNETRFFMV